jgi:membrane protease YdiL (CAAX protease family)
VATWKLDQLLRLTLLWMALAGLTLAHAAGRKTELSYQLASLGRGTLAGLLISVPAVLLAQDFLVATSQHLFPVNNPLSLFWGLVLVMPPIETAYFRGILQREKGLRDAVLLYAAAAAIYFMPSTLTGNFPVLVALVAGMGLLGFVYSYVRALYGVGASLACQMIVQFVVFVVPLLPQELPRLPA